MLSKRWRQHVCHGWAFRRLPQKEVEAVLLYLETGEVTEDFPYKAVHAMVEEREGR